MTFTIEYERLEDGRWLASVKEMPGIMVYAEGPEEAVAHAQLLAMHEVINGLERRENLLQ